jgi:hypothetical protein
VAPLALDAFALDRLSCPVALAQAPYKFSRLFGGQSVDVPIFKWNWAGASWNDKKRLESGYI